MYINLVNISIRAMCSTHVQKNVSQLLWQISCVTAVSYTYLDIYIERETAFIILSLYTTSVDLNLKARCDWSVSQHWD